MMRGLFITALLLGTMTPFVNSGQVHACYCATPEPDQLVLAADIIFVGELNGLEREQAHFVVDRYLKGNGAQQLSVNTFGNSDCSYFNDDRQLGDRFLVVVEQGETTVCSGNAAIGDEQSAAYVGEIQSLTGAGHPVQQEPEADHKDTPWLPILILALIVPTAALLVPSFMAKRDSGDDTGPAG